MNWRFCPKDARLRVHDLFEGMLAMRFMNATVHGPKMVFSLFQIVERSTMKFQLL
jgi:hypothetical protein